MNHLERILASRVIPAGKSAAGSAGFLQRRTAILSIVFLLVFTLALLGCGSDQDGRATKAKDVRVTTQVVQQRTVPLTVQATGSLEAEQVVNVSTRMMGWIRDIHVNVGDWVTAEQPLITIDNSDMVAKRAQAEAAIVEAEAVLANAETMVNRFQKLYGDNSVSKQQLDDAITGRDRAMAGLRAAEAMREEVLVNLSYLEIKAPTPGLVTRKMVEIGNMANPGVPLLVLEQTATMKVVARLGEKHISSVKIGELVAVDITSLSAARFSVPIAEIVHSANPGSRTYDIKVFVDNPDGRLKSGMFARVEVPVGERTAMLVPAESIIARGQLRGLFVVDSAGTAVLRWVRLGTQLDGEVEVFSGLDPGETIVVTAEFPLVEGDKVVR